MSPCSSPSGRSISDSWPEIEKRPTNWSTILSRTSRWWRSTTRCYPGPALAETDWHFGELDENRHKFILQSLKEMIDERNEGQQEAQENEEIEDGDRRAAVHSLPAAHDEADEIAGMMLSQLLASGECLVQSASFTAAADEVADLIQRRTPDVVCISAMPPVAVMHARHLCKLIRGRFPQVPVVMDCGTHAAI